MENRIQRGSLQTIFTIFLGLMVTAFFGIGVYTFYASPYEEFSAQIETLNRQEESVRNSRPLEELTTTDRSQLEAIRTKRDRVDDTLRLANEAWARTTSIILIVLATLVMAASLMRTEQLPVISNGLLLGGVFTMAYGVGWGIFSGSSVMRFVIITVALILTLGLGYARFVRQRVFLQPSEEDSVASHGLVDLEQRVRKLENQMDEAARVFSHKGDRDQVS